MMASLSFSLQPYLKCCALCQVMGVSKTPRKLKACEERIIGERTEKPEKAPGSLITGTSQKNQRREKSVLKSRKKLQCDKRREMYKVVMEPWEGLQVFCGSYLVCERVCVYWMEGEMGKHTGKEGVKTQDTGGLRRESSVDSERS